MEPRIEMWQKEGVRLIPFAASAAFLALGFVVFACGNGDSTSNDGAADAGIDRERLPAPVYVDAAPDSGPCQIEIQSPPLQDAIHVAVGTTIMWDSNPPSSGEHYPIWAAYQEFTEPVPRGFYVHDLEHGGIVFLYNCGGDAGTGTLSASGNASDSGDDAGDLSSDPDCAKIVEGFRAISASIPDDPLCTSLGEGVRVRTVITPDPLIAGHVAAAAWGWTYNATCLDLPSLEAFAKAHYGQGTEVLCNNGQTDFSTP